MLYICKQVVEGVGLTRKELDKCLVDIQQGDEAAFEMLYKETRKALFAFIYTYTNDYTSTEDMLQETYIRIRRNVDKYSAGSNALSWIFTIAKNVTLNDIKKNSRTIPYDFSERDDIAGTYEERYDTPVFDAINECLESDEKRIVFLYVLSGYKHREIAEILGIPIGTVLWKYNKAIKKLKEYLSKEEK